MPERVAIEADALTFRYSSEEYVLRGLSLRLTEGKFASVLGHSGCGKSTLLSLLMGLLRPESGEIRVNGGAVSAPAADRAIVFQDYSLFPWMTARGNVAFGIEHSRRVSKKRALFEADEYLSRVGLRESGDKYPCQMSGGMRQRVAIARALAMDAGIWLFDEPFSALDPQMRSSLQALVMELAKSGRGRTVLFVTHNVDEAVLLSEKIFYMEGGLFREEIDVPFGYPRKKEEITNSRTYFEISGRLAELFCESGGGGGAE